MKKTTIKSLILIVVMLSGCLNKSVEPPVKPEIALPSNIIVPTTSLSTPQISSPSPFSPLPAPTFTITPETNFIERCLQFEGNVQLQSVAMGTIVPRNPDNDYLYYLMDIQSGNRYNLHFASSKNTKSLFGMHVSPDGNKLAYVEPLFDSTGHTTKQKVWVLNAKGEVLADRTINPEILFSEWRWLDNERLQFHSTDVTVKNGTVIVWDISSEKWEYIFNNLPNFYTTFNLSPAWWLVDYSPNMEWVAYLGVIEGQGFVPIVWDNKTKKTIWQATGRTWSEPKWSPLGGEIALVMDGKLYRITRDGQVKSLPDLEKVNKIVDFDWSPNSQYIAFWAGREQTEKTWLMIYDVQSDQVIDYCLSADNSSGYISIWSPDNQQFVVNMYAKNASKSGNLTILIDMKQNIAYEIPKDTEPLAWMNSEP